MEISYNGTGIDYPRLTLGGVEYELKFTRGALLYRISRRGISVSTLRDPERRIAAGVDILHAIIGDQFGGTPEQLADLVFTEEKFAEVIQAVTVAVGKVFPPKAEPAQAAAGAAPQVQ